MHVTSPRRIRTAARGLPVIVLVMLAMLAAAPAATAHHATVRASATCVDGHYVIDWRALSWVATDGTTETGGSAAPWRGLNQKPGITVSYRLGWWGHRKLVPGAHTLTAATTTPVVVNGKTHQFPSTSGSFTVRGNARGELVLRLKAGPWGPNPANGRYAYHRWHSGAYAVLKLKGDCGSSNPTDPPAPTPPPAAVPGASANAACVGTAAVIRVGLANTNASGGNSFAFTVSSPATGSKPSFSQAVTVAANGSSSLDVPVDENGSRTVAVSGSGFSQSFTRTGDCIDDPQPNASAMQVCNGAGAIRVSLTNGNDAGGESVTFTVASPATGSKPAFSLVIALIGGDVRNVDVPVDEDTARTVTVSAPGMSTASFTRTIDCDSPALPNSYAFTFCDGTVSTIVMGVQNQNVPGGASVTFTLHVNGAGTQPAFDQTVVVAGGVTREVTVIADEGTTRAGSIAAPGMTTRMFSFGADCIP